MLLDIVTIEHSPHPEVLTQLAAQVTFPLSVEDQNLIAAMKEKVIKIDGVGLAAPQVGIAKQIIVYTISEDAKGIRDNATEVIPVTVLINPDYTPTPDAKIAYDWEGCFSVEETTGKVPRYDKILYTAQTPEGNKFEAEATGFTARVLQHEIDHVKGKLIIHRLTPDCVQGHPQDMAILRYKEMDPEQRVRLKKLLQERIKIAPPEDTKIKSFKKLIEALDQEDKT